jgi:hypothetical protein
VTDTDHTKSPLEVALEYCVYAPLGFGLEARSLVPRFVARGRSQIMLARVVGKYALRKGAAAAEMALGPVGTPAVGLLRVAGLVPDQTAPTVPGAPAAPAPDRATATSTATSTSTVRAEPANGNGQGADSLTTDAGPPAEPTRVARAEPPFDPDTLAIPGYDSLSASQVVPRLEGLEQDELEAVRRYEEATRGRKTILSKIAQLQAA